jgi:hypothetical protein
VAFGFWLEFVLALQLPFTGVTSSSFQVCLCLLAVTTFRLTFAGGPYVVHLTCTPSWLSFLSGTAEPTLLHGPLIGLHLSFSSCRRTTIQAGLFLLVLVSSSSSPLDVHLYYSSTFSNKIRRRRCRRCRRCHRCRAFRRSRLRSVSSVLAVPAPSSNRSSPPTSP